MSWIVLWKDWIALLWSRSESQEGLRIPVNVHLNDISSTAEPFLTKLGMVMHHHGPECYARKKICCVQVHSEGHSEGSYDQIWLFLIYIYRTAYLFTPKFSWMTHHYKLKRCILLLFVVVVVYVCLKIRLLFSRSRSQGSSKTLLNLYVFYIFCITDLLATKLAELIYYC